MTEFTIKTFLTDSRRQTKPNQSSCKSSLHSTGKKLLNSLPPPFHSLLPFNTFHFMGYLYLRPQVPILAWSFMFYSEPFSYTSQNSIHTTHTENVNLNLTGKGFFFFTFYLMLLHHYNAFHLKKKKRQVFTYSTMHYEQLRHSFGTREKNTLIANFAFFIIFNVSRNRCVPFNFCDA